MKDLLAFLVLGFLVACGDGKREAAEKMAADHAATVADLSSFDLPLLVTLPDARTRAGAEPEMGWREEEGWFVVRAGDQFSLHITEEPGDLVRLKADLERDPIRQSTTLVDEPGLLVYRQEITAEPGLVFVHFYQVVQTSERTFVVESDYEGRFTESEVDRMRQAVRAKDQPA